KGNRGRKTETRPAAVTASSLVVCKGRELFLLRFVLLRSVFLLRGRRGFRRLLFRFGVVGLGRVGGRSVRLFLGRSLTRIRRSFVRRRFRRRGGSGRFRRAANEHHSNHGQAGQPQAQHVRISSVRFFSV